MALSERVKPLGDIAHRLIAGRFPHRKENTSLSREDRILIYFDQDCLLCRNLAGFLEKAHPDRLAVQPRSALGEDQGPPPAAEGGTPALLVKSGDRWLQDLAAWEILLEELPSVKSLSWLPRRLFGIQGTARLARAGGRSLRRLCWRCPG